MSERLPALCERAGLEERYTNHCLRSTFITEAMYANVADADIQAVTGHRSLEGLNMYKQLSAEHAMGVQKAIAARLAGSAAEIVLPDVRVREASSKPPESAAPVVGKCAAPSLTLEVDMAAPNAATSNNARFGPVMHAMPVLSSAAQDTEVLRQQLEVANAQIMLEMQKGPPQVMKLFCT